MTVSTMDYWDRIAQQILDYSLPRKELWILPEDADYLEDKYSGLGFAERGDLDKFIMLAFSGISGGRIDDRKQELRTKFGIGTGNTFEAYLKQQRGKGLEIPYVSRGFCNYGREPIDDLHITQGPARYHSYTGLCRKHSKEMNFVRDMLGRDIMIEIWHSEVRQQKVS